MKMAKKRTKNKKLTKKDKERIRLEIEKSNLKNRKRVYNTYLKALIEYKMESLPYTAIRAQESFNELLLKLSPEEFSDMVFTSNKKLSEKEEIEREIKYYDNLIKRAKGMFELATYDVKMKIADDAVKYFYEWSKLFLRGSK